MGYVDYLTGKLTPWLSGPRGVAWARALGQAMDDVVARARAGTRAKSATDPNPLEPAADRLAVIGQERQLIRPASVTDSTFAAKLASAWDLWTYGGTALGLLRVLYDLGYTQARLMTRGRMYALDGSGNLVSTTLTAGWTTGDGSWTSFDIFFAAYPTPATGAPSDWSAAMPSPTSDEIQALKRQVALWKPAHAKCVRIVVQVTPNLWGYPVTLTWGQSGLTWGGGSSTSINLNI